MSTTPESGASDHSRVEIENGPHFDYKDLVFLCAAG